MKRIVLIFFFFIGFSSYGQSQQDTSFFEISTLDGSVFLDPKLPQRPADSIKCCNNYLSYDEEYMEETFFSKIDSIAKELGIYEQLMDRGVYMDFYFKLCLSIENFCFWIIFFFCLSFSILFCR